MEFTKEELEQAVTEYLIQQGCKSVKLSIESTNFIEPLKNVTTGKNAGTGFVRVSGIIDGMRFNIPLGRPVKDRDLTITYLAEMVGNALLSRYKLH